MITDSHAPYDIFLLVYVSNASRELTSLGVKNIEEVSHVNNTKLEVTGILLFSANRFMQILEGPELGVLRIFLNIRKDSRHHGMDLLRHGAIPKRQFGGWSMRLSAIEDIDEQRGIIHDKLFKGISAKNVLENAQETQSLLLAFKHSY